MIFSVFSMPKVFAKQKETSMPTFSSMVRTFFSNKKEALFIIKQLYHSECRDH